MKMLDPRSVVRESEFALAASTGNIPARVMAMYDRVVKGGTLDATMRQDLVKQSRNQFDSAVKSMARKHKDYTKRGEKYGSMGVNASRALEFSSYEPLIDTRHFNPLVTVDDNNKVDPNNRLNLKRKPR
jgi:Neuraminidase (sialidase)